MNEQPILDFIAKHELPKRLKMNADNINRILLNNIAWEMGLGHGYELAAEMACTILNGEASDLHLSSGADDSEFYCIYEIQSELVDAIKESYK